MTEHGDCFVVAARAVLNDPTLTLVHGLPLGTGGPAEGKRYWHAWVERDVVIDNAMLVAPIRVREVIDRSNGHDVTMPAAAYYQLGRIEQTWQYAYSEVMALLDAYGHWGPWAEESGAERVT